MMLEFYQKGMISLERIVEKMCHAPAQCFNINERGYLREGYFADIAIVDLNKKWTVSKNNLHYKCNWSPFEGHEFQGEVTSTIVSGHLAYHRGQFWEHQKGQRMTFNN